MTRRSEPWSSPPKVQITAPAATWACSGGPVLTQPLPQRSGTGAIYEMFSVLATSPVPTVAAAQGHLMGAE